jgi:hypothetical protein
VRASRSQQGVEKFDVLLKINRTYPAKPHLATVVAVEITTDSSHNGPLPFSFTHYAPSGAHHRSVSDQSTDFVFAKLFRKMFLVFFALDSPGQKQAAKGTLGTWYSEQSELAEAATSPHARNRSDSIYKVDNTRLWSRVLSTSCRAHCASYRTDSI